jgi:hypothetical protein
MAFCVIEKHFKPFFTIEIVIPEKWSEQMI